MHRFRHRHRFRHITIAQITINLISNKRCKGSSNQSQLNEHSIKSLVGLLLIQIIFRPPEPSSGASDIPIIEQVNKFDKRINRFWQIVEIKLPGYLSHHPFSFREDPAVKGIFRLFRSAFWLNPVNIGIGDKKGIGIPQWNNIILQYLFYTFVRITQIFRFQAGGMY
ncbi:hypothetical protein ES707_20536 [subsurface metagenome]